MALNKYTFWDLTGQAVLFQTTSQAACLKHVSKYKDQLGHTLAHSLWPFLTPGLSCPPLCV